ncbi:hypothetical protein JG688_00008979 [Phytophthora aleatoria]|uniref:Uncharacterized protein n=1 Tax=Phytophthora aleatoria TaxID=2496075 RepID=A0A8J5M2P3_9STRA|nr:hypothetical protein JG688_00008979 [Phytophthora aleatoria]
MMRLAISLGDYIHPSLSYLMRNWDSMKERWALYARSDIPHLGNHTNNRYYCTGDTLHCSN